MSAPNPQALSRLEIAPEKKTRRTSGPLLITGIVLIVLVACVVVYMATQQKDRTPIPSRGQVTTPVNATPSAPATPPPPAKSGDVLLTVSGYVVPHARIEISPRFQGTVRTINVKKG